MTTSTQFSLNKADFVQWGKNLLIFLVPVALIYVLSVIASVNTSFVSFASFIPNHVTVGAMTLYILNAVVDLLRKYQGGAVVSDVLPPAAPTQ